MDEPAHRRTFAWQPLTARGVAAFASGSFGRLFGVQLIFALLAAATVAWAVAQCWFPAVRAAILELPATGAIRAGHLSWAGGSKQKLSETRFLSLAVDLNHEGLVRSPSHVQVELGSDDLKIISLLGGLQRPYPKGWVISMNRPELEPWFGAWSPAILAIAAGLTVAGLFLSWAVLASIYFVPTWLLGFFANRDLGFGGAWRLCGAACLPGSLLLTTALFFYALSLVDLVRLLVAVAIHFAVAWVYVVAGVLPRPRHPLITAPGTNPFAEVNRDQKSEVRDQKSEEQGE